jgi:hypothetical protein
VISTVGNKYLQCVSFYLSIFSFDWIPLVFIMNCFSCTNYCVSRLEGTSFDLIWLNFPWPRTFASCLNGMPSLIVIVLANREQYCRSNKNFHGIFHESLFFTHSVSVRLRYWGCYFEALFLFPLCRDDFYFEHLQSIRTTSKAWLERLIHTYNYTFWGAIDSIMWSYGCTNSRYFIPSTNG